MTKQVQNWLQNKLSKFLRILYIQKEFFSQNSLRTETSQILWLGKNIFEIDHMHIKYKISFENFLSILSIGKNFQRFYIRSCGRLLAICNWFEFKEWSSYKINRMKKRRNKEIFSFVCMHFCWKFNRECKNSKWLVMEGAVVGDSKLKHRIKKSNVRFLKFFFSSLRSSYREITRKFFSKSLCRWIFCDRNIRGSSIFHQIVGLLESDE